MRKIFLAMVMCMTLFFGSTTHADDEGMQALREALQANLGEDTRVFHQDILFYMPTLQSALEIFGSVDGTEFQSRGEFNVWAIANDGTSSELSIPYYATQKAKDMKIYFQMDKKWYLFQSPSVAAAATDMILTPDDNELENTLEEAKEVTILRDTDKQRTLLVKIDGNKLADNMKKTADENPADNGTVDDKDTQDKFFQYLDTALRNADTWYTWTINKTDNKTMTLSIHLSGIVQEFARAALNDKDQVWEEPIQNILENVAFYSEAKAYTTFLNAGAYKQLEIPKDVLKKAKPVKNFSDSKK